MKKRIIRNVNEPIKDISFKISSQEHVPEYCKNSFENNVKRNTKGGKANCDLNVRCHAQRNYEPEDFKNKCRLGQLKINQELALHGHPSSRSGKAGNTDQRREELKRHNIFFHQQNFD